MCHEETYITLIRLLSEPDDIAINAGRMLVAIAVAVTHQGTT